MEKAKKSLKKGGIIILAEPVLAEDEEQKERLHSNKEQQLVVRPHSSYSEFFQQYGFYPFKIRRYEPKDC